ncbi:hypothetical protein NHX12_030543 [Muraenolepis orangiensis]|uniref:RNase H type-1 domain-containing protein n=1 Tax=Muraenolepis orangiensis TaxID=630683 RepID=A0A9Q0ECA2_9TELE|nr:hypothetical protein NHX12_030543 [Muraenolepis orangiensis]
MGNTGEVHDYEERSKQEYKIRADLTPEPNMTHNVQLFSDGCCYKGPEGNVASYSVVADMGGGNFQTVDSGIIPQPASAQLAELVALTKAIEYAQDRSVCVYTDSGYAHGAVHLDALPCARGGPEEGQRRARGGPEEGQEHRAMKQRTLQLKQQVVPHIMTVREEEVPVQSDIQEIEEVQQAAGAYEKSTWIDKGATAVNGLWRAAAGRLDSSDGTNTAPIFLNNQ